MTGIPPVVCGSEIVAGEVAVSIFDILPMFRRCGTGPQSAQLRRLRMYGHDEWLLITDPVEGIKVSVADLLIPGHQVYKFEDDHDLMRRVSGGTGSTSLYDWDGMIDALIIRIHEKGVPATQSELITDMQDWFAERSDGDQIPDERSIRRRVSRIWKMLAQLQ